MGEFSYQAASPPPASDFAAGYGTYDPGLDFAAGYADPAPAVSWPLLGAILLEMGVLDTARLQEAVARQHETGSALTQALLDLGHVAPDQLAHALSLRARQG